VFFIVKKLTLKLKLKLNLNCINQGARRKSKTRQSINQNISLASTDIADYRQLNINSANAISI